MVDCYTHRRKTEGILLGLERDRAGSIEAKSNEAVSGRDAFPQRTRGVRRTRMFAVQSNGINGNNGIGADSDTVRDPAVEPSNRSESEHYTFTLVPIPTIVDPGSGHLVRHKTVPIGKKGGYSYKFNNIDPNSEPDDLMLMLCQHTVWAFSFRGKEWDQYHVDDLEEVDYRKKSFDRLVLNVEYKAILKAMVAYYVSQGQKRFKDLVAGKGQGLVILLHGK